MSHDQKGSVQAAKSESGALHAISVLWSRCFSDPMPAQLETLPVLILASSGSASPGMVHFRHWRGKDRIRRGFRASAKVLVPVILFVLPFGVMEPFLFMIWGSVVLGGIFLIAGPVLFLKYADEKMTFSHVDGRCPACGISGKLTPYLSSRLGPEFRVLCPECGQSFAAHLA